MQSAKIYDQRGGISVNQLAVTSLAKMLAAVAAEDCNNQRVQLFSIYGVEAGQ